jgi:hypothetical protein
MKRHGRTGFLLAVMAASMLATSGLQAADKTVVFPFDLVLQKKEEDFYIGPSKPNPDEQRRLDAIHAELIKLLGADTRYDIIDLAPIAKDIETARPLVECNGCEFDLAKKAGTQIAFTGIVDKASDTLLNMQIARLDVGSGKLLQSVSVVIQGNTDEAWMRGVRWLVKNRLSPVAATKPAGAAQ